MELERIGTKHLAANKDRKSTTCIFTHVLQPLLGVDGAVDCPVAGENPCVVDGPLWVPRGFALLDAADGEL